MNESIYKVCGSFPRGQPTKTWNEVIRSHLKERKLCPSCCQPPLNISTSPILQFPLNKKHHMPTPILPPSSSTYSGTEVLIPLFTDINYKIIKNFRFLKTCLSRYDAMILHLKTFSNILIIQYIAYTSHYTQALKG